jgi:hypothetical protein
VIERRNFLIVCLGAAARPAMLAAPPAFQPKRPKEYPSCQKIGPLEIAAVKYESDAEINGLFGKANPNEYGVLPVLLIFENKGKETVMLDRMRVLYQFKSNEIEPVKASDLPYLTGGPKRPNTGPSYPIPIPLPKKKNPLSAVEFETRAFGAKVLLPGEAVHGFFYFEVRHQRNAFIYITGMKEGTKDLFFAEVPLDPPA